MNVPPPGQPPYEPSTGSGGEPRPRRNRPEALSETGRRVFQSLSLGLVVFDRELQIMHRNPAAEFLVAGQSSLADALTAGTVEATYEDWGRALRQVIETGEARRFDQVIHRPADGPERLLNLQCIPLPDADGSSVAGGTLVIEDVTVAASMEQRLAVSERMAAVGKLAAKVAHELNNPMDGILRYLSLARRSVEAGATDKLLGYLDQARGGLLRMTQIVRELVEFSRSAYTAFDDTGINNIVEEAIKVMSDKAVQAQVSIVCTLTEGLPAVRGTNLFQVFCNMIKNAVDAMPEGGTLSIQTRLEDREVQIVFDDTGIGLPAEIQRIFEPFFTTKPAGKGTGLGLAICKDIIEKYNGRIEPVRRPEGGTRFIIHLPLESCVQPRPALHPRGA